MILILTAGFGDGHNTAARSVAEALTRLCPEEKIETSDLISEALPFISDVCKSLYQFAITHWPDPFETMPPRVALTLAGHTHCGQVNLPILGRPILPSPASHRWPCGLYDEGGRMLFVPGGVGTSVLPVRFRAPPEIVIVTLRARR